MENAGADRLTRMGMSARTLPAYRDRSTHAMENLNAYTLSVCLRNHFNSPEIPDSSYNACAMSTLRVRIRYVDTDHLVGFFNAKKPACFLSQLTYLMKSRCYSDYDICEVTPGQRGC